MVLGHFFKVLYFLTNILCLHSRAARLIAKESDRDSLSHRDLNKAFSRFYAGFSADSCKKINKQFQAV